MGFQLPKLTGWVNVPVYDGMEMECWLNPTYQGEYQRPENAQPWESEIFWSYGQVFLRLRLPASMTDSGEEEILELGSAKAVWELWRTPGFDQSILPATLGEWSQSRHVLMKQALGN